MDKVRYFELDLKLVEVNKHLLKMFKEVYFKLTKEQWQDTPDFGQKFITSIGEKIFKGSKKIQKRYMIIAVESN